MLSTLLALFSGQATWATVGPVLLGITFALITGITFHEFGHAFTAYSLGDPTPKQMGRVTLNPTAHIDPMGALFFLIAGFGWGRPVQFQPYLLRINPRVGSALVAIAGPIANFILATVFGLTLRGLFFLLGQNIGPGAEFGLETLAQYVYFNLLLGFFNLIPIPPLDGFGILLGVVPAQMAYSLERVRQYGFLLLFLLVFLGGGVISTLLLPPIQTMFTLLTGLR